ncbi:hypothetical protein [Candidatus Magnetominusculus xianensis]|uniref:Uncharacterized protein n=1 Tax=Candidatus Magnetominusculus xianensis TaxID=1748249 RepID=A0ABR5SEB6_9BACT|nr:hypothetical protein [Candidatus Magnetominusculus xianensis]KWT84125.1 hypothetical protein ASN18_2053 [Candidatus Magnetominusculus xianensis]MBF0402419.1 hypothetical protein [Nitrospirota bacterium]
MNRFDKSDLDLYEASKSEALRFDMQRVAAQRHNPFVKNGQPDIDAILQFLMEYNEFINHEPKPFRKIIDTVMLL